MSATGLGTGRVLCGVVVSSGKMMGAIKVRTAKQVYHRFLKKHFQRHESYLVSDPTYATRTGDVVKITDEGQISKHIRHIVTEIVSPWGPGVDERPAVLSEVERIQKRGAKRVRRAERKAASKEGTREAREGQVERGVEGLKEGLRVGEVMKKGMR